MVLSMSLVMTMIVGGLVMWPAAADAAPVFHVAVSHTPTVVYQGDRRFAYGIAFSNTGALAVGDTVSCSTGTWATANPPTSYGYRWMRNGQPIGSATSSTYTVVAADAGTVLQCEVTGSNAGGAAESVSAGLVISPTPAVTPPASPSTFAAPAVSGGTIAVGGAGGATLTCNPGSWTPAAPNAPSFTYQWYRNGVSLGSANGAQTNVYTVQAADLATAGSFQCAVIGTNSGGATLAYSVVRPTTGAPASTTPIPPATAGNRPAIGGGAVTLQIDLPLGVTPLNSEGTPFTAAGWACTVATLTCTRSDIPAVGDPAYPAITLRVALDGSAPDELKTTATITGGGSAGPAVGQDSFTLAPAAPFGANAFSTSVVDSVGTDYTQAGGHPFTAATSFNVNSYTNAHNVPYPVEDPKTIQVDLPPGFLGNPQNAPMCESFNVAAGTCPVDSQVGIASVNVLGTGTLTTTGVYNIKPRPGHPAQFAFVAGQVGEVNLFADVRTGGDYGLTITTPYATEAQLVSASFTFWGVPADPAHNPSRCQPGLGGFCLGGATTTAPLRPFLSNPTGCGAAPPVTTLEMDSWQHPGTFVSSTATSPAVTGCDQLAFEPTVSIVPDSTKADQPIGLGVHIHIPQVEEVDKPSTPPLRDTVVTLPQGMAINPSLAEGLQGCTDAQFAEHDGRPGGCPQASKIGTLEVTTPVLDHKLPGSLYVRQPDPEATRANGLYTLFLEVDDPQTGVIVKLRGSVVPDTTTGQLKASFTENPQLPFSDLDLQFKGGPNGALINSGACGPQTTQAQFTPWAGPNSAPVATTSTFTTEGCGPGGFKPGFEAGTSDTGAGHYSPFTLRVTRNDSEQNVSTIDATLPVGLTAKLAGVPLCGDAEAATGTCPTSSQVGSTTVGVGAGSNLLFVPQPGKAPTGVYLAGPYKGDPYSLVVKVPAQAGPFDLGTVAVRSAIHVDPETAQVSVHSDPLPQILEGVPLTYRDIRVNVDRPGFTLNPTSCNKMSVAGRIGSAAGAAADVSSPFQVGGCEALAFAPKLNLRLKGATGHTGHPALTATVTYPQGGGYANIARAQVNLPHGEFLDQGNLNKTCTRPVLLEGKCPESSVYGHATAWTPLLDKPLEGNVYLVGGYGYKLPALVADLDGQIRVTLVGKVDSGPNKGIRNTFEVVPDAPVEKFELTMKGGKKYGLLENSEDLCKAKKAKRRAIVRFTGQNGAVDAFKPLVQNECRKHKKKKHNSHSGKKQSKQTSLGRLPGWAW